MTARFIASTIAATFVLIVVLASHTRQAGCLFLRGPDCSSPKTSISAFACKNALDVNKSFKWNLLRGRDLLVFTRS